MAGTVESSGRGGASAAFEKVGDRDTAETAAALCADCVTPTAAFDAALGRLTRLKQGPRRYRRAAGGGIVRSSLADGAAQAPFAKDYPPAWRDEVFEKTCEYLEAADRRADPLLFLLRESDAADLRDRLEQRALIHRKKKDYATALTYLRLLGATPSFRLRWS